MYYVMIIYFAITYVITYFPLLSALNLLFTTIRSGLVDGSSIQHSRIKSFKAPSTFSSAGSDGLNGGVSPLRTRPTKSER